MLTGIIWLQYDKQDQVERNLDLLEGKDPDAARQKQPLQPSMRQNESHAPADDNTGHKTPDISGQDNCSPSTAAPATGVVLASTPGAAQMQPKGDSEENDPRGAAAMDTSPDAPVRFSATSCRFESASFLS